MSTRMPIFTRISVIEDLGVFGKRAIAADTPDFKHLNLIYGFNGSGKTTLSRMFLSIANMSIHAALPKHARFEITLSDNSKIRSDALVSSIANRILVFNVDFIDENIRWKDGTANPVYYIGKMQADLSLQLEEVQQKLAKTTAEEVETQRTENGFNSQLTQYKQDLARLIAEELNLGRRYNAAHLTVDYGQFNEADLTALPEDERRHRRALIGQDAALPKMDPLHRSAPGMEALFAESSDILSTSISDNLIEDVRQHISMLGWFKRGLDYHEEQSLESCIFCGNPLGEVRLAALRRCIDERFDHLLQRIEENRQKLQSTKSELLHLHRNLPSVNDFTQEYQHEYTRVQTTLVSSIVRITEAIDTALLHLHTKSITPSTIFNPDGWLHITDLSALQESLDLNTEILHDLIVKHNDVHEQFVKVKEISKNLLKFHYLSEGFHTYTILNRDLNSARAARQNLETTRAKFVKEVERIKAEIRQHGPAAERITKLLSLYLGHSELEVSPLDVGYKITRKGRRVAGPLSEGEKSALALCYFISMLGAEDRKLKDLILVVDDPVSSLDCNALNYTFSLLKNTVGSASQVIILTHNLQFMNETKKWLKNKIKDDKASIYFVDQVYDLLTGERSSLLVEMPKYLREYESEYHFLFKLLLDFSLHAHTRETYFHIMPNAMRNILDIYLAFKIPGSMGLASKIDSLISAHADLDPNRLRALDRLVQLESHGDNLDDLISFSSMTVEETRAAAGSLLSLIERTDVEHYGSMCSLCK